jgi:hypothetical protein
MPLKCYNRERKDGSSYTTCNKDAQGQSAKPRKPKPVHTLAEPRKIGSVARPKAIKRPGAQHGGTGGARMGAVYKAPVKKPVKKPPSKKEVSKKIKQWELRNVNNFSFKIDTGGDGEREDIKKTTLNEFIKMVSDNTERAIKQLSKTIEFHKKKGRQDRTREKWVEILKEQLKKGISPADIKTLEQRVNMSPTRTIYFTDEHRGGGFKKNIEFGQSLIYVVEAGGKINNRKYKTVNFLEN